MSQSILLLEAFDSQGVRGIWTKDLNYLALVTRFVRAMLRFTGPMRLGAVACPPLGLAQLAAGLKQQGYDTWHPPLIHRALKGRPSDRELRQRLGERLFDGVVLSVGDPLSAGEARRYARICKELNPRAPVVVGGSQPTFYPESWSEVKEADYVVRGQGDLVLPLLLDAWFRGHQPPRLAGVGVPGRMAQETTDLVPFDQLPPMDFEAVALGEYMKKSQVAYLQASQGCAQECPFCLHHRLWGKKTRLRPVEHLEQEIRELEQGGCKLVYFIDSAFTADRDHALRVADMIERNGFDITFTCETRADCIDEELLRRLKAARFALLWLGGESGSPRILQRLSGKGRRGGQHHLDSLRRATGLAEEVGILVGASWIIGLPGESRETVAETFAFMEELSQLGMAMMDIRSLLLLPGTAYAENPEAHGLTLVDSSWENKEFRADSSFAATEHLSARELAQVRAELNAKLARLYDAKGLNFLVNGLASATYLALGQMAAVKAKPL
jgi:radical SAM superfamily enzyme YgiQ (UPF0313 family)